MAAAARQIGMPDVSETPLANAEPLHSFSSIAILVDLHAEAVMTTRLGKLPSRSLATAALFAFLTGLTMANGMHSLTTSLIWAGLVMSGAGAILCCYSRAVASPFQQRSLEQFSRALQRVTVYCGIAWGLGAFLVLPADAGFFSATLFVGAPVLAVTLTLRERELVLSFLLPMLVLSSFAALLRPLPDATLTAAVMLITGALLAAPPMLIEYRRSRAETLSGLLRT